MTELDVTDPKQLSRAVKALAKECRIIKAAHEFVGVPEWRTRQGDYAGLARIIAYQQLSTKAAGEALRRRLVSVVQLVAGSTSVDSMR